RGVCQSCPLNSYSVQSSDELVDCKCLAGFVGVDGAICTSCIASTYKELTGDGSCSLCATDTYSAVVASTSMSTCLVCPSNTFSAQGSNELVDCKCLSGFTGPDGFACNACSAGSY
ncbi:hypothetical protein T484DRAFT_1597831, partial [Baffinella frigidus]